MALNLNEKAKIAGLPVVDFMVLIVCETVVFFVFQGLWPININLALGFFIIVGGLVFVLIASQSFMPDRFLSALYKYFSTPDIYLSGTSPEQDMTAETKDKE
jgi:hypothetical protein